MTEDRRDSIGRLASRERDKTESESAPDSEEQPDAMEGSQSPTDADAAGHPPDDPSDPDAAESADDASSVSVKDRGSNLFMYLPQSLGNEVDLACQSVNLTYQREHGQKLGKNRYLYPIILMIGIDAALDLSAEDIADLVEKVDEIEDGR